MMSLFDKKPTVEDLLQTQVSELKARVLSTEQELRAERADHEKKQTRWLQTEQDLIETICLLKGIPVPHHAEDPGAPAEGEEKPTPSHQRLTWPQAIARREREARDRAKTARSLEAQKQRVN